MVFWRQICENGGHLGKVYILFSYGYFSQIVSNLGWKMYVLRQKKKKTLWMTIKKKKRFMGDMYKNYRVF